MPLRVIGKNIEPDVGVELFLQHDALKVKDSVLWLVLPVQLKERSTAVLIERFVILPDSKQFLLPFLVLVRGEYLADDRIKENLLAAEKFYIEHNLV